MQGSDAVDSYLREASDLGFDVIELSTGFVTLPWQDLVGLVARVKQVGRWLGCSRRHYWCK